jgi:hypothetical protein
VLIQGCLITQQPHLLAFDSQVESKLKHQAGFAAADTNTVTVQQFK